ncbi:unnamed protein product [Paramecium sonneborni]|uniref:RING-type domain-containing protein n=1 Tax=Paramecium sonneborni TaxID=65129 RepID=A0A8S1N8F9_9CILI|nr:unnamed protein product [Paramecium sonneborni]
MKYKEELGNIKFIKNLKKKFLQQRRSQTNLDDYKIKKKIKLSFRGQCREPYKCSLCKDYFIKFVTTLCSHSFCKKCLFESHLVNQQNCPICKFVFSDELLIPTLSVDEQLQIILKDNKEYQIKLQNFKIWNQNLKIQVLEIDMKLDVLDKANKWCEGKIKQIKYNRKGQAIYITVNYEKKSKDYDEMINTSSNRLAPFGMYTQYQNIVSEKNDIKEIQRIGQVQSRILFVYTHNNSFHYPIQGRNDRFSGIFRIL